MPEPTVRAAASSTPSPEPPDGARVRELGAAVATIQVVVAVHVLLTVLLHASALLWVAAAAAAAYVVVLRIDVSRGIHELFEGVTRAVHRLKEE